MKRRQREEAKKDHHQPHPSTAAKAVKSELSSAPMLLSPRWQEQVVGKLPGSLP